MNIEEALLRADEPRRPLDWRFRRAVALSQAAPRSRRFRTTDDKLVKDYSDMFYRLREYETYPELEKIRGKYPDLFRVHLAYATLNATELALADAMMLCRSVDPKMVTDQTGMNETQQKYYRDLFLDIADRRQMSSFIASQIMEPSRLRATAVESDIFSDPEKAEVTDASIVRGSFSSRALCVLRLVGFYSSPVVVELLYSGMLADAMPEGRDAATKYITQAYLTNVRRKGMMSAYLQSYCDVGIESFMKLAYSLAAEEQEDTQFALMQNLEQWAQTAMSRIVSPVTMEPTGDQVLLLENTV